MRLWEMEGPDPDDMRLLALAKFLSQRAEETGARLSFGLDSFLKMANRLGVSVTAEDLRNRVTKAPLNSVIANVEGNGETGTVIFQGGVTGTTDMTVDQAQQTVDKMAKRAMR